VTVHFYATLRQITGQKTVSFDVARPTVTRLLDAVVEQYPAMRTELLDESGGLWPHVHVFVNGRDAPYLEQGLDTELGPDDTVDVFPAVAGG